jgi:hypothetical protein
MLKAHSVSRKKHASCGVSRLETGERCRTSCGSHKNQMIEMKNERE